MGNDLSQEAFGINVAETNDCHIRSFRDWLIQHDLLSPRFAKGEVIVADVLADFHQRLEAKIAKSTVWKKAEQADATPS